MACGLYVHLFKFIGLRRVTYFVLFISVSSPVCKTIGFENNFRNDLNCIERGVKPTYSYTIVSVTQIIGSTTPKYLGGPNLRPAVHVLQTIYDLFYMPQLRDKGQNEITV